MTIRPPTAADEAPLARAARWAFAITWIAIGAAVLLTGRPGPIFAPLPPLFAAHAAPIARLCGCVVLFGGIGLLWRRTVAAAAGLLLVHLLGWFMLGRLRLVVSSPGVEASYQACGESMVLIAGVWVLYAGFARRTDRWWGYAGAAGGLRAARALYGLALLAFGLSHFVYLGLTAPLVPRWLPWHEGFAYATGAAYLLAGLAVLLGRRARLAATLAALQMAGFTALVWVPRIAHRGASLDSIDEFTVSWCLTVASCLVTASYGRGRSHSFDSPVEIR
ncbi:MAG: hypothetical protein KGL34_12555 [Gammaproteobacteria bacterium]|nr:hypothetical protein [Gammaproteobacteria bacterium]